MAKNLVTNLERAKRLLLLSIARASVCGGDEVKMIRSTMSERQRGSSVLVISDYQFICHIGLAMVLIVRS